MNASASRLLAPAILVLLVAGIIASAIVGNDSDADAAARTTTTVAGDERGDEDDEDDDGVASDGAGRTTTTATAAGSTTTTAGGSTTTTRPAVATTTTTASAGAPVTAAPPTTSPTTVAAQADLAVLTSTQGEAIRFSVQNSGPGSAPGIVLTITGAPGPVVQAGTGVSCSGTGTITCTIATSGVGGIVGFVDLARDTRCPQVSATVRADVEDPDPSNDTRTRALC